MQVTILFADDEVVSGIDRNAGFRPAESRFAFGLSNSRELNATLVAGQQSTFWDGSSQRPGAAVKPSARHASRERQTPSNDKD